MKFVPWCLDGSKNNKNDKNKKLNRKFGNILIRDARIDDALSVIQVHYDSVHHVALKDYPIEILDEWSPPISEERIAKFLNNGADVKLVAERNGHVVGFGELLTDKNQLGAVYVASSAVGQGVGKAIMTCLEELAVQKICSLFGNGKFGNGISLLSKIGLYCFETWNSPIK